MDTSDSLRRRAEEALDFRAVAETGDLATMSQASLLNSIHELEVHRIELQMQNEELRRTQTELVESRARFFDFYYLAPEGFITLGQDGRIGETNLGASTMLGLPRSLLLDQPFSRFIEPMDQDIWYLFERGPFQEGLPRSCELRIRAGEGKSFWARISASKVRLPEGTEFRLTLSDVTERKAAEEVLQDALREKRELLAELQHRAKNSFHMISGLINIAATSGGSPETAKALGELDQRVRAVAELYELLNASKSFSDVRLDEYCARVIAPLVELQRRATVRTELEPVVLPIKKAAPLGLILTELVTNAVKYGFPGDRRGTIRVVLRKTAAGALLEVSDDGVGLEGEYSSRGRPGMGLNLVKGLAGQIEGSFRIEGGSGTRCTVEFPL